MSRLSSFDHARCVVVQGRERNEHTEQLDDLIKKASTIRMTDADKETQRRQSFAYGNANIENANVAKAMVEAAVKRIARG